MTARFLNHIPKKKKNPQARFGKTSRFVYIYIYIYIIGIVAYRESETYMVRRDDTIKRCCLINKRSL